MIKMENQVFAGRKKGSFRRIHENEDPETAEKKIQFPEYCLCFVELY